MRWISGWLADRSSGDVRGMALGLSALIFSVLVVEVQPLLTSLDPLLQLLIAAVSIGTIVAFLEWLLQWLRTRSVRGQWVYRSTAANWGLAEISQVGYSLGYEVQLFATKAGVEAALDGRPVPAEEVLGHTTSTFCEFEDGRVSIRYVVGRTSNRYEKRAGFLELVPQDDLSRNMVGYWTSTLDGSHGELHLTRPEHAALLEGPSVEEEGAPPAAGHAHVVGLGLIGGSFALALRAAGWRVTATDPDATALDLAAAHGIGPDDGSRPDLVVLAGPTPVTVDLLRRGAVPDADLVVDVSSVKAPVVAAAEEGGVAHFVGLHPMAGTEGSGFDDARADMLTGAVWALCPTTATTPELVDRTIALLRDVVSARVCVCDATAHDRAVAEISHLPHALALALLARPGRGTSGMLSATLAAGSFRDGTRVAHSTAERISDMLTENDVALAEALTGATGDLTELLARLRAGDDESVRAWVDQAQADEVEAGGGSRRIGRVRTEKDLASLVALGERGWLVVDASGQHLQLARRDG